MLNLWRDLKYDVSHAIRTVRQSPGFTVVTLLIMALGIGSATAMFSVVDAVMLRPLPYHDPNRICLLWKSVPDKALERDWTSYPVIRDWRERNRVFEDLAVVFRPEAARVTLTGAQEPEEIQAAKASANLFPMLGVLPILGRTFSADEAARGEHVVVLSHGFWQRRFGASPAALGQTLEIDSRRATIIGVMPAAFQFPGKDAQIWLLNTADARWSAFDRVRFADAFCAVGRLRQGVSLAQAQADMDSIAGGLAREYPATDAGLDVRIVPLPETVTAPRLRQALWVLFGAVACVLLIACTNVASLLLARGVSRRRELAVRSALGAGRGRLVRQLLTESVVLSLGGGLVGLLFAWGGLPALASLAPPDLPRLDEIRLHSGVLGFAIAVSLLAGVAAGLAPAWQLCRREPYQTLQEGGQRSAGGRAVNRSRGLLVAAQFALAVLLLAGAGLLVRSFQRLQAVDLGFEPERVLMMQVRLPNERYKEEAQSRAFFEQAIERVETLPGVTAAAVGGVFRSHIPNTSTIIEGRPALSPTQDSGTGGGWTVSDGYFRLMGIPLRQGRLFSNQDAPGAIQAAIINEAMARRFWPGENPIGRRFKQTLPGMDANWLTVVGIAGDVVFNGPESGTVPLTYRPLRQQPGLNLSLLVRTRDDPLRLAVAIRREIRTLDRTLPPLETSTIEQRLRELSAPRRFQTMLLGLFAALALLLAAAGVYGLMQYTVSQRTREIGIRMALGARPHEVTALFLRQGLRWAMAGMAVGVAAALALTQVLASLLFEITASDPATFLGVVVVLTGVAVVASAVPARRVARVDPLLALREE